MESSRAPPQAVSAPYHRWIPGLGWKFKILDRCPWQQMEAMLRGDWKRPGYSRVISGSIISINCYNKCSHKRIMAPTQRSIFLVHRVFQEEYFYWHMTPIQLVIQALLPPMSNEQEERLWSGWGHAPFLDARMHIASYMSLGGTQIHGHVKPQGSCIM